jgi:hypothetical protein
VDCVQVVSMMLHVRLIDDRDGWHRNLGAVPTTDRDLFSWTNRTLLVRLLHQHRHLVRYGQTLLVSIEGQGSWLLRVESLVLGFTSVRNRPDRAAGGNVAGTDTTGQSGELVSLPTADAPAPGRIQLTRRYIDGQPQWVTLADGAAADGVTPAEVAR